MTAWLLPVLAGFCTGILSAWGVGGGTLLLLLMTLFLGVEQSDAMAINLLYFLPTAAMGLLYHRKNGLLERPVLRAAAPWGTAAAAAGALLATAVDVSLLRRPFGIYLLLAAASLLLQANKHPPAKRVVLLMRAKPYVPRARVKRVSTVCQLRRTVTCRP